VAKDKRVRITPLAPETIIALQSRGSAGQAALEGVLGALPTTGRSVQGERRILALGPEEWLLLAEARERDELVTKLIAATHGVAAQAVDVSDIYEGWTLIGADARALLARSCTLDLERMPAGACTRTVIAGITVILVLLSADRIKLRVERSYAAWMGTWLGAA
jgi:sarcosine oxidase subunit gamma